MASSPTRLRCPIPRTSVDQLSPDLFNRAPGIKEASARQGSDIPTLMGPEFGEFVSSEIERWATLVKSAGIKLGETPARWPGEERIDIQAVAFIDVATLGIP